MAVTHTERLMLRPLRLDDADAMDQIFGDSQVMRFGDGNRTPAQVRQWINQWTDELYVRWGFGIWAVVRRCDEATIGYCGLSRFAGRVAVNETEIGFRLARAFWNQGYASEAVIAVRDYAFMTLAIPKLAALIDPNNLASIRVVEKAGFVYERDVLLEGYHYPDRVYCRER